MSLDVLRDALATHGGTLAQVLATPVVAPDADARRSGADAIGDGRRRSEAPPGIGAPQLAARGPRAAGDPDEYELLLEMILEGSLLHYGRPRVVITEDRDLALLLGDQLYALGLARLADLGDLESVSELADLISLLSQAQLDGNLPLARAIWKAGATAIGWGSTPEHEAAKALARSGDAAAVAALIQSGARELPEPFGARAGNAPPRRRSVDLSGDSQSFTGC